MAMEEQPNRATLALVDAKVGVVDAKVDGLRSTIETGLQGLNHRLDLTANLPGIVVRHDSELQALKDDVAEIKKDMDESASYKRLHLPVQVLTAVMVLAVIAQVVLTIIH